MDLTGWIKHEARALGFHLVGVTSADPFPAAEAGALTWLEEQRNGEMAWLTREHVRAESALRGALAVEADEYVRGELRAALSARR